MLSTHPKEQRWTAQCLHQRSRQLQLVRYECEPIQSNPPSSVILFAGGDTNLYGYVINDPINFIDPDGEHPVLVGAAIGVFFGAFLTPTPTDTPIGPVGEGARVLGGAAAGAVGGMCVAAVTGAEIAIGGMRFAPLGNRTGNPNGGLPHYHRRTIDPATGQTAPGQGIGRHRPWDTRSTDRSFWDRF